MQKFEIPGAMAHEIRLVGEELGIEMSVVDVYTRADSDEITFMLRVPVMIEKNELGILMNNNDRDFVHDFIKPRILSAVGRKE